MWAHVINAALAVWLMLVPTVLEPKSPLIYFVIGPLLYTFSCIAICECTRNIRWLNVILGLWLILSGWVAQEPQTLMIHNFLAGGFMIGLSLVKGKIRHCFGGGWAALFK